MGTKNTTVGEFYAETMKEWRKWLKENGEKLESIWLLIYKKDSGIPSVSYIEAVEEALCFGWIDSKANKRDEKSYIQSFAKRNPRSNWSQINKKRVEELIAKKRMTKRGLKVIEEAKANGNWQALEKSDELILPADLKKAFRKNSKAQEYFNLFPKSTKKAILEWILNAKKEETRTKRIEETVSLAEKNIRANQWSTKVRRRG